MQTQSVKTSHQRDILFEDWGQVDYVIGLQRQLEYVKRVQEGEQSDTVVFCTHSPVVTLGRASQPHDLLNWRGPVVEVSRGGRATYHGPSQLLVYPIFDLAKERAYRKSRDVVGFLRGLENAIVSTLKLYGISSVGKSLQRKSLELSAKEETGVWVGERKIASLGIAVKRWVTFHGAAINLFYDSEAFKGLNPCGFKADVMVSLEELLQAPISRKEFQQKLQEQLLLGA